MDADVKHLDRLDLQTIAVVRALARTETRHKLVCQAIDDYRRDHGRLPTTSQLSGVLHGILPERAIRWHIAKYR